ncbi:MAG: hypothetical protein WBB67_11875 [bacterium]
MKLIKRKDGHYLLAQLNAKTKKMFASKRRKLYYYGYKKKESSLRSTY